MIEYEYYDWTSLISTSSRKEMVKDIDLMISKGDYWKNSPPFQTNINVFGVPKIEWINLKMSFIWSAFAFMGKERQIKSVKSWAYKTNLETQEDRNTYWHQHIREDNLVVSGVFYLQLPEDEEFSYLGGTELAYNTPDGKTEYCPGRLGHWIIFPGKTWHRPGILESDEWRYIVAADMEI